MCMHVRDRDRYYRKTHNERIEGLKNKSAAIFDCVDTFSNHAKAWDHPFKPLTI